MTMIELSDEQAAALAAKAAAQGLTLQVWLGKLAAMEKALDALDEKPTSEQIAALRRKNFVELCDPVRGLAEDIEFSRNPSTARPLDL